MTPSRWSILALATLVVALTVSTNADVMEEGRWCSACLNVWNAVRQLGGCNPGSLTYPTSTYPPAICNISPFSKYPLCKTVLKSVCAYSCEGSPERCSLVACTAFRFCKNQTSVTECRNSTSCASDQYCFHSYGECVNDIGECLVKPQICTKEYNPVCGCNGRTYSNPCMAASDGASVLRNGQCTNTSKVIA